MKRKQIALTFLCLFLCLALASCGIFKINIAVYRDGTPFASTSAPTNTPTSLHPSLSATADEAVLPSAGLFTERESGLDSTWSVDVSLGDLDGDGDLDVFLGHHDAASTVWLNDGSGQFTTDGIDLGTDFFTDVPLGDLDGDGDLDVIFSGIQDHSLWRNNGDGSFQYGGPIFEDANYFFVEEAALSDLDGDGDLDAVTTSNCNGLDGNQSCDYAVNHIWWNDGSGKFLLSAQTLGHGTSPDVGTGDLDNDGDIDVVITQWDRSVIWMNQGDGTFSEYQTLDDVAQAMVELGDLDNDGDLDAFFAQRSNTSTAIWLNDGHGTFTPGQGLGVLDDITLGDLNGDGALDALSIHGSIWINQGNATFASGQDLIMSDVTLTSIALGDLNGDGRLDAIASGYDIHPLLWLNQFVADTP